MKNIKHFAALMAIIAMSLAACQEAIVKGGDGDLNGDPDGEGKTAMMSLSFTVPTSTSTRAVQDGTNQAALAAESTINTVDVYIFKSTGVKADLGAHTRLVLADFTETSAGSGIFTLNADKLIKTLSGDNARVYVGANLGNAFNNFAGDEGALLALTANVDSDDLQDPGAEGSTYQTNNFTMFGSAVAVIDLKTYAAEDPASVTKASIQLERVAAKVLVTAIGPDIENSVEYTMSELPYTWNGQYTVRWGELDARSYNAANFEEVEITYTFKDYLPIQNARQTYVAPNFLSAAEASELPFFPVQDYSGKHKTYTPYNGSLYTFTESNALYSSGFDRLPGSPDSRRPVYTGSTSVAEVDVNTLDRYWFYMGENRDYRTPSANGKSTYMMVCTWVGVNRQALFDNGDDGIYNTDDDGGIYYTTEGLEGSPLGANGEYGYNGSILIVKNLKTGRVYITMVNGDADGDEILDGDQIAGYVARNTDGWVEGTSNMNEFVAQYIYPSGFVYFPVYLDGYAGPHTDDRYGVFRNQFLHVNITGIFGAPGAFPGYPGDPEGDPSVDPNNPTDPRNPDPNNPNDPIDGQQSALTVEFRVQPWYYLIKDGTILQ